MSLTDKNLYAYCDNNPVMRTDESGEWWVFGAIVGAVVNSITTAIVEFSNGVEAKDFLKIGVSAIIGAAEGALTSIAPGASMAISALASASESAINDVIDGKDSKTIVANSIASGIVGMAAGAGGTEISNGNKLFNDARSAKKLLKQNGLHPTVKKKANATVGQAKNAIRKIVRNDISSSLGFGLVDKFTAWNVNRLFDVLF